MCRRFAPVGLPHTLSVVAAIVCMYSLWLRGKVYGLRLATTTIALVLIVGLQSCAVYVGGGVTSNQDLSGAGAVGLLIALLFLSEQLSRSASPLSL